MEKDNSIDKVVGVPKEIPELERKIQTSFDERFHNQAMDFEIIPSFEQRQTIEQVILYGNSFLKEQFGIEPKKVTSAQVHIVDHDQLSAKEKEKLGTIGAEHSMGDQNIVIYKRPNKLFDNLTLAEILAHEFFHLQSFHSYSVAGNKDYEQKSYTWTPVPRRSGLGIIDYGKNEKMTLEKGKEINRADHSSAGTYFEDLNEAVTQELTIRFLQGVVNKITTLHADLGHTYQGLKNAYEKQKKKDNSKLIRYKDEITQIEYGDDIPPVIVSPHAAYKNLRKNMNDALQLVAKKNSDRFKGSEEAFEFLVQCYFNGKLLEFTRILEKTYGKGTFTNLAERTKRKPYS